MSLNFYRRVAFGLSPNENPYKDPLNWAINQLDTIPDLLWPGSIPTEKDYNNRKKYVDNNHKLAVYYSDYMKRFKNWLSDFIKTNGV